MNELKNGFNKSEQKSNEFTSNVNEHNKIAKKTFYIFSAILIFIIGLACGIIINFFYQGSKLSINNTSSLVNIDSNESHAPKEVDFSLFWSVWDLVKERHINQPVNEIDMFYGAIAGMVAGVNDPYSVFFNPEESEDFLSEINGSFEGIGAEIGLKNKELTIVAPLPGSPAELAGIRSGDIILAIDDIDAAYMTVNTAVQFIRGEKGTTVNLKIKRENVSDPMNFAIVRNTIQVESVKWKKIEQNNKKIIVITISHFNSDTALKFKEALNSILLEQPTGIILDLRNNAGGFLDASIDIASKFIEEGNVVVYEESGSGNEKSYKSSGSSPLATIETVVLQNGGSASASEILAGALKDYKKAIIVGTTSFGKGTVQDFQTFSDGSSLKLTVSRWLTPGKSIIDNIGVIVDYNVERTSDDFSNDKDPQYEAALQYFTDRNTFLQNYPKYESPVNNNSNSQ